MVPMVLMALLVLVLVVLVVPMVLMILVVPVVLMVLLVPIVLVGLCDNGNSCITILQSSITIIMIMTYIYKVYQNIIIFNCMSPI